MLLRILTGVVGLPLLIPFFYFADTIVFPAVIAIFSAIGVFEMLSCIGVVKKLEITIPSILISMALPFGARFIVEYEKENVYSYFLALFAVIAFGFMFYLMCLAVVSKGKKTISDMMLTFAATMYITVGFASVVMINDISYGEVNHGRYMCILIFIGAWLPDIAAYFFGKMLGKHKLIPDVSPKKTVEGAVAGVLAGGLAFAVFGFVIGQIGFGTPRYVELVITGICVAVVSIFGDLIASLIKRQYGIKDYGKVFPGHGGVLDRFDSIIAISPFLLMICSHPDIFKLFI